MKLGKLFSSDPPVVSCPKGCFERCVLPDVKPGDAGDPLIADARALEDCDTRRDVCAGCLLDAEAAGAIRLGRRK